MADKGYEMVNIMTGVREDKSLRDMTSTATATEIKTDERALREAAKQMISDGAGLSGSREWQDRFQNLYHNYKKELAMVIAPKSPTVWKDHERMVDDVTNYDPLAIEKEWQDRFVKQYEQHKRGKVVNNEKQAEKVAAMTTVVKLLLTVLSDGAMYRIEDAVDNASAVMKALGLTPAEVTAEVLRAMDDWYERVNGVSAAEAMFVGREGVMSINGEGKVEKLSLSPSPPPVKSPSDAQDRAKYLLVHPRVGEFNKKEHGFLESLTVWRGQPTYKQLTWLRDLELRLNPV